MDPRASTRTIKQPPPAGTPARIHPAGGALLLSLAQAAQRLGLSEDTIRSWRWRYSKGLALSPAARALAECMVNVGRSVKISEGDLARWIRERRSELRGQPAEDVDELRAELLRLAARLECGGFRPAARVCAAAGDLLLES